jgi:hypothetical protein
MTPRRIAALLVATILLSCGRKTSTCSDNDAVTRFVVARDAPAAASPPPDAPADPPGPDPVGEPGADRPPAVPPENVEKGDPPGPESAEQGARLLFEAIRADDASLASSFFFPAEAFDLVKNMDDPRNYHRKLVKFFEEDIHAEHGRYFGIKSMEFDSFEMGKCSWKEPYTQGNRLPYWSCRASRLIARSGTKRFDFKIHVLINWADRWYVIHLGPIRTL